MARVSSANSNTLRIRGPRLGGDAVSRPQDAVAPKGGTPFVARKCDCPHRGQQYRWPAGRGAPIGGTEPPAIV